jgi:protein-S-isoprenylcysteine O-methyltransferase Ste14
MTDTLEAAVRAAGIALYAICLCLGAIGGYRARSIPTLAGTRLAARIGASPAYLLTALPYFAICAIAMRPIPWDPSDHTRIALLVVATIVGLAGFGLYVCAHAALGRSYDVSSGLGTVVHEGAPLVTRGPYARVRHPMYAGIALGALAGLALYRTWTFVFVLTSLVAIVRKSRMEDRLLAERYGLPCARYRSATPAFVPRLRSRPPDPRALLPRVRQPAPQDSSH